MNKLYINYDPDPEFEAHLCVCSDDVVYNTCNNFLRTKFNGEYDDGDTYSFFDEYNGFVVWENRDKQHCSFYPKEEFLHDMELLGFEIVIIDEVFQKFTSLRKYINENNL
jgi:hypothetical protein